MQQALGRAPQVFAVSGWLARLAVELGADPERVLVVGNGVDTDRFRPEQGARGSALRRMRGH
jgi:hypothetical protein